MRIFFWVALSGVVGCADLATPSALAIVGGAPDDARPWVVAVINWDW